MGNISKRLIEARGDRTQAEFARFLGIKNQVTLQRYETGERTPNGIILYQIASRLGISMEELLLGSETAQNTMVVREASPEYGSKRNLSTLIKEIADVSGLDENEIRQAIAALMAVKK